MVSISLNRFRQLKKKTEIHHQNHLASAVKSSINNIMKGGLINMLIKIHAEPQQTHRLHRAAKTYEMLMDLAEDIEFGRIIEERKDEKKAAVELGIDEL